MVVSALVSSFFRSCASAPTGARAAAESTVHGRSARVSSARSIVVAGAGRRLQCLLRYRPWMRARRRAQFRARRGRRRVTGETGITPIGALGKVTQLTFGLITPGNVAANLMTANVTGGAAGQCADLMTDLRTGYDRRRHAAPADLAQSFGILVGSMVGTLCYLVLIPDPATMLITPEWPAPRSPPGRRSPRCSPRVSASAPDRRGNRHGHRSRLGVVSGRRTGTAAGRRPAILPSAPALGLAFSDSWRAVSHPAVFVACLPPRARSGWRRAGPRIG